MRTTERHKTDKTKGDHYMTTCRKPARLDAIIKRVRRWGEYRTRKYYYEAREVYTPNIGTDGYYIGLQLVRIERDALGTTCVLDPDEWQLVAVLY